MKLNVAQKMSLLAGSSLLGIVPILDVPGPVRRVAGSGQQCPPRVAAATPA